MAGVVTKVVTKRLRDSHASSLEASKPRQPCLFLSWVIIFAGHSVCV